MSVARVSIADDLGAGTGGIDGHGSGSDLDIRLDHGIVGVARPAIVEVGEMRFCLDYGTGSIGRNRSRVVGGDRHLRGPHLKRRQIPSDDGSRRGWDGLFPLRIGIPSNVGRTALQATRDWRVTGQHKQFVKSGVYRRERSIVLVSLSGAHKNPPGMR